ncbi:type II secretion system protein [Aquisphaera insulae]|uniref:type II secretion system protein n=1 Tax=Aquisphaera insulae TaxID=2712864 RepID=UPI0013E9AFCB|nr:type II secretion system protein [Aquisphaera insulae]
MRSVSGQTRGKAIAGGPPGFTLVELLAVIVIIGIILMFILKSAMDGIRRAEERATQSLIIKLESGLNDRLDALLQNLPTPNYAHAYLAGIYPAGLGTEADSGPIMLPAAIDLSSGAPNPKCLTLQRAQVIAAFDFIRAEMPDVFYLDPSFVANPNSYSGSYAIQFTGLPFPGTALVTGGNYMLPLGHMVTGPRNNLGATYGWTSGFGDGHIDPQSGRLVSTHPEFGFTGSGINGASYPAAAALYKGLGISTRGYDMVDNDGNGLVDDFAEWFNGVSATDRSAIVTKLAAHTHKTARAEMLYALLVEGVGPLGSVFNRDDFTDREVRDTDGDGLPEFVDAWGEPLQFFRWPLLYHSDLQRGQRMIATTGQSWTLVPPYGDPNTGNGGNYDQREQNPLDLNQQLMAPAWWSTSGSGGLAANGASPIAPVVGIASPPGMSSAAHFFASYFHRLSDATTPVGGGLDWDRAGGSRRAFYTKFLVLSAGEDKVPGVFLYSSAYLNSLGSTDQIALRLLANENGAMPFGWNGTSGPAVDFVSTASISAATSIGYSPAADPEHPSTSDVLQAAQDDITNQNVQSTGGIGGSG